MERGIFEAVRPIDSQSWALSTFLPPHGGGPLILAATNNGVYQLNDNKAVLIKETDARYLLASKADPRGCMSPQWMDCRASAM